MRGGAPGSNDSRAGILVLAILLVAAGQLGYPRAAVKILGPAKLQPADPGILYTVTDGPTPVPIRWRPLGGRGPEHLNPDGDDRGDGEPDFGWNATSDRFEAVWSRVADGAQEVAWSYWAGSAWSEPLPLSPPATTDLLPRVAFTTGGDTALCYRADDLSIRYRELAGAAQEWGEPVTLTTENESAGRPDLADPGDGVRVAFPLAMDGAGWSIVVESRVSPPDLPPAFGRELIALSSHPADPEVRVESQAGRMWITWVHDESHLGWSRLESRGWTPPELVLVESGNRERARFLARQAALHSP